MKNLGIVIRLMVFTLFVSCEWINGGGRPDDCFQYKDLTKGEFSFYVQTKNIGDCNTNGEAGARLVFENIKENDTAIFSYKIIAEDSATNSVYVHKESTEVTLSPKQVADAFCEGQGSSITYTIEIEYMKIRSKC